MRSFTTHWVGALVAIAILGSGARAAAQTDEELAAARAAFMEGVELSEQERWEEAAARFRAVMAVRATGQVKFNLGLALSHTNELAEALLLLREAADDGELDRRTRRQARTIVREIEPRLGQLTVHLRGDSAGLSITLDGEPLGLDRVNVPFPANPGTHRASVTRGGRTLDAQSAEVTEGGEATIVLNGITSLEVVDDELATTDDEPSGGGGSVLEEWWFWTIIGAVVVVGVGVGIGVAVSSDGTVQPVSGNLDPGFLEVMP